jgi:hypothetical protein
LLPEVMKVMEVMEARRGDDILAYITFITSIICIIPGR